jgi:hypothetical protein
MVASSENVDQEKQGSMKKQAMSIHLTGDLHSLFEDHLQLVCARWV